MFMCEDKNTDNVVASDRYEEMAGVWLRASLSAHGFIAPSYWIANEGPMREKYLPASENYAYVCGGELKGFISLSGNRVEALFVGPGHQGRGIGRALLEYAKGLRSVLTLDVYEQNRQALRFYERNGFARVEESIDHGTGHTQLRMEWGRI